MMPTPAAPTTIASLGKRMPKANSGFALIVCETKPRSFIALPMPDQHPSSFQQQRKKPDLHYYPEIFAHQLTTRDQLAGRISPCNNSSAHQRSLLVSVSHQTWKAKDEGISSIIGVVVTGYRRRVNDNNLAVVVGNALQNRLWCTYYG
jgi:hypothetical protein